MEYDKANTPPANPFQASLTLTSSVENPGVPGESDCSQDTGEFKPMQMLMETPLTVECGVDLTVKLVTHEELLCCHSKLLSGRFAKAKPLRAQYKRTKTISDQLAEYVFPEVSPKEFEDGGLEAQVMPLIIHAYDEQLPLVAHLKKIKMVIDETVQEQITAKNIRKITAKDLARAEDLPTRLSYLKSRSIQIIAERLFVMIHQINKKEEKIALNDEVRAAAQHRIFLPGVDEETVLSLMRWIYQGTLHYQDTERLYNILQLAIMLGVEALAETCLTKLYNAASDSIRDALDSGVALRSMLGFGPDPVDNVLGVIFKHVTQDKCTPKRLQDLITDTLAVSLDKELFEEVKGVLSLEMALQIIEAMLCYGQHAKSELCLEDCIKDKEEKSVQDEVENSIGS
ncbi:hypothetical protein GMOD_00001633 [Pyrenophora seminiperda CCB06]|uniref:BTB domain-containing protein n=1 Tax=Pyrenophora seminiperda CCB06 TaxID=1302712 RepID=A0A3M7LZH5_9PLEO|nr:hypothetical protein GMOD_00001633 [Pyrenophora seminiperda CCB06]